MNLISMDKERLSLNGDDIYRESDTPIVLELIKSKSEILVRNKCSVFIEGVNIKREWREWIVSLGQKYNVPVFCVCFNIDLKRSIEINMLREERLERFVPTEVLYRMVSLYEKPTEDEGFVLVNPDFRDFPENCIIFTVGLPGCGKTTLFNLLQTEKEGKLTLRGIIEILKNHGEQEYYYIPSSFLGKGVLEMLNDITFVRHLPSPNDIISIDTNISFDSIKY